MPSGKKKNRLWLRVTNDKYRLIIAMSESAAGLAKLCGCSENSVVSSVSHWLHGDMSRGYEVVEFDEDLEPIDQIKPAPVYSCRAHKRSDPDYEQYLKNKQKKHQMEQYIWYDNYSCEEYPWKEKKRRYYLQSKARKKDGNG